MAKCGKVARYLTYFVRKGSLNCTTSTYKKANNKDGYVLIPFRIITFDLVVNWLNCIYSNWLLDQHPLRF